MRAGKTALVIAAAVSAVAGVRFVTGGATLIWASATQRDAAGFCTTPAERYQTSTYALTSQVDFGAHPGQWWPGYRLGAVRVRAAATAGRALVIGIAPRSDVDTWLSGVAHKHVTSVTFGPVHIDSQQVAGTRTPAPPAAQSFWVESTSGSGTQTLLWPTHSGHWSVVVTNADATAGINAEINVGARTGVALPMGVGLGVFGLLLLAGSVVLLGWESAGAAPDDAAGVEFSPAPSRWAPAPTCSVSTSPRSAAESRLRAVK
ncbi:MAG: hypothetical protein M3083_10250 [Actinomycetota bacterium]|nr:hypothetical protein [Actinomycetota bacterium]